jgi:hypothetical protein
MPVKPITKDKKKELVRISLEQLLLGNVPLFGNAITTYGRIFLPSEFDKEVDRWRSDGTCQLDKLESVVEKLSECVTISDLSFQVGLAISSLSDDGIAAPFPLSIIMEEMPAVALEDLIEACGELSNIKLAYLSQRVNSSGSLVIKTDLFKVFDPFVHGWHPTVDAATLADYVADQSAKESNSILAETIADHFKWSYRRLNPALQIVGGYISEGRKFTGYAPPWVYRHIRADPTERAALRQMAYKTLGK